MPFFRGSLQLLAIAGLRCVQHRARVVAREEVLCRERGDRCGGVFAEESIMTHADAHEDVQVCLDLIEQERLHDGIADHATFAILNRIKVEVCTPIALKLAADRLNMKACLLEQLRQCARLMQHDGA